MKFFPFARYSPLMGHPHQSIEEYTYKRHRPEEGLLYQVVAKYLQPFLKKCEESEHPVPRFIKSEFEAFLRCGILSYGFARVYCQSCKYDRLVAFSCKKRGFCGSCLARRMSETSGRLIDEVIPHIPSRQWVLSLPVPLRYLVAFDNDALLAVTSVFMKALSAYLRCEAKKRGGKALEASAYYPGAISFIQRFGSALNLNVHIHSQVSDGVYVRLPEGRLWFLRMRSPTDNEIRKMTTKIAFRIHRYLEKRINENDGDALEAREPLLAKCYAASIRSLTVIGVNAGKPLLRLISPELIKTDPLDDRTIMGFNLHASKPIEADDRDGLERTLRYMGRPPLSKERLNKAPDGERLILTLKSPRRDGTAKIVITPFELLERLVALVPPPRKNQIRYHGFFAPNSHLREEIVANRSTLGHKGTDNKVHSPCFAKLLARVFAIDVLACPRCGSRMQRISLVREPSAIRDILRSLKMATAPPEVLEPDGLVVEYDGLQVDHNEEEDFPNSGF